MWLRLSKLAAQLLQAFMRVNIGDTKLLGAPLFSGAGLDKAWSGRCDDLARAVDRLRLTGAQDALILLRSSFSAPKVDAHCLFHIRYSSLLTHSSKRPSRASPILLFFPSLPVKDGGLGIRRVFARTSRLFGFSGKYTPSPGEHPVRLCLFR